MEGPERHVKSVVVESPRHIKLSLFHATVESVLLYGCESWTLTHTLQKSLDGCYTRMLRVVLNISKSTHITNENLYAGIFRVSDKIAARRMSLAGHCQMTPSAASQQTGAVRRS